MRRCCCTRSVTSRCCSSICFNRSLSLASISTGACSRASNCAISCSSSLLSFLQAARRSLSCFFAVSYSATSISTRFNSLAREKGIDTAFVRRLNSLGIDLFALRGDLLELFVQLFILLLCLQNERQRSALDRRGTYVERCASLLVFVLFGLLDLCLQRLYSLVLFVQLNFECSYC